MPMATPGSHSEIELVEEASATVTSLNRQHDLSSLVAERITLSLKSMLTRFHAGYFRISLSIGGQVLLWKTLISPTDGANPLRHLFHLLHPTGFFILCVETIGKVIKRTTQLFNSFCGDDL